MTDVPPPPPAQQPMDAKMAKANAKAAAAQAKALRPWYKKKRFILPIGLVVIVVAASLAGGGAKEETSGNNSASPSGQSNPPENDVVISSCKPDEYNMLSMELTVTNHSSKPSTYLVEVAWESEDGKTQFDTSIVSVSSLKHDQSTVEEGLSLEDSPDTPVKCVINDVTRLAS